MFKCVKIHEYRVRDLFGSTNCKRRGVAKTYDTYIDPSAVGVHNENSDEIWSIYTCSLTRSSCYAIYVRRYISVANFAMNMHVKSLQHT